MKTTIKKLVNEYFPNKPNIHYLKRKWETKICNEDKGGSFNINLYLDYLAVINENQTK